MIDQMRVSDTDIKSSTYYMALNCQQIFKRKKYWAIKIKSNENLLKMGWDAESIYKQYFALHPFITVMLNRTMYAIEAVILCI